MFGRGWRSLCCLLAIALVLAGCASAQREASGSGSVTAPTSTSAQPTQITAVHRVDAGHIRVTAQVPAPKDICARQLAGRVTAVEGPTVFVQLTFTTPVADHDPCSGVTSASTVVAIPPLGERQLAIDWETPWVPVPGSSSFRQCTGQFGCDTPPTDHCDPAWLELASQLGERPPERSYEKLGCTQRWLVMNVSATVTGCQLTERPRPAGCRGSTVRWFLEFHRTGWVVVASGQSAGCASVHRQVPAFPTTLCERLPAG